MSCLWLFRSVTRNCVHRSSPNWIYVCEGNDYFQLIKFWPSCAPGTGVCDGAKMFGSAFKLLQSASSLFASLRALCSFNWGIWCLTSYPFISSRLDSGSSRRHNSIVTSFTTICFSVSISLRSKFPFFSHRKVTSPSQRGCAYLFWNFYQRISTVIQLMQTNWVAIRLVETWVLVSRRLETQVLKSWSWSTSWNPWVLVLVLVLGLLSLGLGLGLGTPDSWTLVLFLSHTSYNTWCKSRQVLIASSFAGESLCNTSNISSSWAYLQP